MSPISLLVLNLQDNAHCFQQNLILMKFLLPLAPPSSHAFLLPPAPPSSHTAMVVYSWPESWFWAHQILDSPEGEVWATFEQKFSTLNWTSTCCTCTGSIAQPTAMYLLVAMAGSRRNLMWRLIRSWVTVDGRCSGVALQVQVLHMVNPVFGLVWGASCLKSTGLCTPGQQLCLLLLSEQYLSTKKNWELPFGGITPLLQTICQDCMFYKLLHQMKVPNSYVCSSANIQKRSCAIDPWVVPLWVKGSIGIPD